MQARGVDPETGGGVITRNWRWPTKAETSIDDDDDDNMSIVKLLLYN